MGLEMGGQFFVQTAMGWPSVPMLVQGIRTGLVFVDPIERRKVMKNGNVGYEGRILSYFLGGVVE